MVFDRDRTPSHLPFSIVRKGFDRDEVTNYFARFEAELRVTATDRDAAAAQARDLSRQLENARNEIDELRRDVDRLSVPPTTAEGMSDRISRMLRLASDEASELRARAEAEAAEMISLAEQEGIRLRGDYEAKIAELERRRVAFEEEHAETMAAARAEANRIIAAAEAERDRLAAEAEAKRAQVQQDFEITMGERRSKLLGALDELERTSKAEADRRVEQATQEAARRLAVATEQSERKIANARDLTEELRVLRSRILTQLDGVREQLESVPSMLAAVTREGELLDRDGQSTQDDRTDRAEADSAGSDDAEASAPESTANNDRSGDETERMPAVAGDRGRSPAVTSKARR
ncbi:hypothetical protein M1M07_30665 [Rhodococcus sp. HM1]|uniref:hypothetical protein n=1 Tax=unclassified Rhodococcus (in: high G+C Gram-positive bacteria) TaxID=192944 RepID=UPI0018CF4FF0|nr:MULTISPECIES: hypothetical protein [unclassified Rhodococcus (in: high G+C Gram-positive bacteria)]MBH0122355.1 hypothetical protein [Rhodococcus sp. CX]MCK8675452.1 hypothetical protein [Rhodococcus sp. HM1]